MKKTLRTLLATLTLTTMMATSAYAAEWLVDPSGYTNEWGVTGINNPDWKRAETKAEIDKWVDERIAPIAALPTEREKVDASIKAVVDYFDYDTEYHYFGCMPYVHIEKKVITCGEYATFTSAMLTRLGIYNRLMDGASSRGVPHTWNYVVVDGVGYHFDPTAVDTANDWTTYTYSKDLFPGYVLNARYEFTLEEAYDWTLGFVGDGILMRDGGTKPEYDGIPTGYVLMNDFELGKFWAPENFTEGVQGRSAVKALAEKWIAEHPEYYIGK